jgi:excinuclease UvrABC nuclease subunit
MKASKFFYPYFKKGKVLKCSLDHNKVKDRTGVYLVKEDNKVVYVGYSIGSLYKTIYRHFQSWNDKAQDRKVYNKTGVKIRVFFCTPKQADRLETYLIQKLKPRDNKQTYQNTIIENVSENFKYLTDDDIIVDDYSF